MSEFNPKESFQVHHKEEMLELLRQRESRWLTLTLTSAMSQLAHSGADASELKGARRLIDTILNLPEKPGEARSYPKKELSTYDTIPGSIKQED